MVAAAAFDTHLERILQKFLLFEESKGKKILGTTLSSFSARINTCYCLGLIDSDEYHDLNLLRDIRNSFAHNLFECNFENVKVREVISNLRLIRRSEGDIKELGVKPWFLISVMLLDKSLLLRLKKTSKVNKCEKLDLGKENL